MAAGSAGGGNGDLPAHNNEVEKPKERRDPSEKASKSLRGAVSFNDQKELNQREQENRDAGKSSTVRTAGRLHFGECAIADKICGHNKDTAVSFKDGLPDKIDTNSQSWQRDHNNGQLWHVTEGDKTFNLKADVRLQGNDIVAKVNYGNGRQVTFRNGEAEQIKHPDGEIWKADHKHPGTWDVSKPNKEDPDHPHHTTIKDVKVNVRDGDITWHVDKGLGAGHNREIDAGDQYHDRKGQTVPARPIEPAGQIKSDHPLPAVGATELPRVSQSGRQPVEAAPVLQPKLPEHAAELPKAPEPTRPHIEAQPAPQPKLPEHVAELPKALEPTRPHFEAQPAPQPKLPEHVAELPKAPEPTRPHIELKPTPLPKLPEHVAELPKAPEPTRPHFEAQPAPQPKLPEHVAELPKAPEPTRPHIELKKPTPLPKLPEQLAELPKAPEPTRPHFEAQPAPLPKPPEQAAELPKAVPHLEPTPLPLQRIGDNRGDRLPAATGLDAVKVADRLAQARDQAIKILPTVAMNTIDIPSLPPAPETPQVPTLPVIQPAVLRSSYENKNGVMPAVVPDNSILRQAAINHPDIQPLKVADSSSLNSAPQPLIRPAHDQFLQAPAAPVPVEIHSPSTNPELPVPIVNTQVRVQHDGPAPQRAKVHADFYVPVVPSIPKAEPAPAERAAQPSAVPARADASALPPAQVGQARLAGKVDYKEQQQEKEIQSQSQSESAGKNANAAHYKAGMVLTGGVQDQSERPHPAPVPTYGPPKMYGVASDGRQYPLQGSAEQNRQALHGGLEAQLQRAQAGHPGGGQRLESNEGYLTGGGNLDAYNRFQVPPGALSAGIEQGHQVIVNIYNYQSGQAIATGQAYGHMEGPPGAPNRILVIDGPDRWAGKQYNLQKHQR